MSAATKDLKKKNSRQNEDVPAQAQSILHHINN